MTRRFITTLIVALAILILGHSPADAAVAPITVKGSPTTIVTGGKATLTVSLAKKAGANGATLWITSSDTALLTAPASVKVASGKMTATFKVTAGVVFESFKATITVGGDMGQAKTTFSIAPIQVASVSLSPAKVVGGQSTKATVKLNGPAGKEGAKVDFSADGDAKASGTITIKAGATSGTFTIKTPDVTVASKSTISASFGGAKKSATLNIVPVALASVSVSPSLVIGGNTAQATVTLNGPAGPDGAKIETWIDGNAKSEGSLYIEPGKSSGVFTVWTGTVDASTKATAGAAYRDAKVTGGFTIAPLQVASIAVSTKSVIGGNTLTATVTLNGPAGPDGIKFETWADGNAKTEGSLVIAAGKTSGVMTVYTGEVGESTPATVGAALNGAKITAAFTIIPLQVKAITLDAKTVIGGGKVTATVELTGPAGADGLKIETWADSPAYVDGSVAFKAGKTTATFTVSTKQVDEAVTVNVGAAYGAKKTVALTINPLVVKSITLDNKTVIGGGSVTATVELSGPAGPDGLKIETWADSPAYVDGSVSFKAGKTTATFTVNTKQVNETATVNIGAAYGAKKTVALTINPLVVKTITLDAKAVIGGGMVKATVELSGPAGADGMKIEVWADSPAYSDGAVTIKAGKTTGTFTVGTSQVSEVTNVSVGAAYGVKKTVSLTINPLVLTSVSVSSASVASGATLTGTVNLSGAAGPDGAKFEVWTDGPAKTEDSAYVEPGASSASFTIWTGDVKEASTVTVGAAYNGVKGTTSFTVSPVRLTAISAPESTTSGSKVKITVSLTTATANGMKIGLKSGDGSLIALPDAVEIAAGKSSVTFSVAAGAVKETTKVEIVAYDDYGKVGTVIVINPAG